MDSPSACVGPAVTTYFVSILQLPPRLLLLSGAAEYNPAPVNRSGKENEVRYVS